MQVSKVTVGISRRISIKYCQNDRIKPVRIYDDGKKYFGEDLLNIHIAKIRCESHFHFVLFAHCLKLIRLLIDKIN